jgi:hypothetical protein
MKFVPAGCEHAATRTRYGGANLVDLGGCSSSCSTAIPASKDTYSGFAASGYGAVLIVDYGGTADKLIIPFASTDAYFEAADRDGNTTTDALIIMSTSTEYVLIQGQLEPSFGALGRIETIQFTDNVFSIGSDSQVATLCEASVLSALEKDMLKQVAKKAPSQAPSSPTRLQDINFPK